MNDNLYSFEDFEMFLNDYPIDRHINAYDRSYGGRFGCNAPFELKDYIAAFKHQCETGKSVINDYIMIFNTLIKIKDFKEQFFNSYSYKNRMYMDIDYDEYEDYCNTILNYNGFWDIDELMSRMYLNKDILMEDYKEVQNNFPILRASYEKKVEKDRDNFIEQYYSKERILSSEQIDDIFKDLYNVNFIKNCRVDKGNINVENVKYPVLLILFENDEPVYVSKVKNNLAGKLGSCLTKQNFNSYSYNYFSEDIIDDIYAEFLIRFNPKNMINAYLSMKNSIYRSLNHIKQRYKGVKDIDMGVIKKVVNIYKIPVHHLNSGQIVVDKDLFDKAINEYYGASKDNKGTL